MVEPNGIFRYPTLRAVVVETYRGANKHHAIWRMDGWDENDEEYYSDGRLYDMTNKEFRECGWTRID